MSNRPWQYNNLVEDIASGKEVLRLGIYMYKATELDSTLSNSSPKPSVTYFIGVYTGDPDVIPSLITQIHSNSLYSYLTLGKLILLYPEGSIETLVTELLAHNYPTRSQSKPAYSVRS